MLYRQLSLALQTRYRFLKCTLHNLQFSLYIKMKFYYIHFMKQVACLYILKPWWGYIKHTFHKILYEMKICLRFLCPRIEWSGAYCFCPLCLSVCLSVCLFVCLSVVNFNLRYNFWTVRDRDFIFGMHTPLMTPRSMTLWPWLWPWS